MDTPQKLSDDIGDITDERPEFIKNNEVSKGTLIHNKIPVPYTIVKKELAPDLKGFLGYPGGKYLFISEEVPEKFRDPQLIHEIIEFTELKGKKGRCIQSLKYELSFVEKNMMNEYIEYRKDFFKRLIEYYKDKENSETFDADEFRGEIQQSYEYLQTLK